MATYKLRAEFATMPELVTLVKQPGKESRVVNLGTNKNLTKTVPATAKIPEHTKTIPSATQEDIDILGPLMPNLFELVESKRATPAPANNSINS